jgi:mannonate dehydratase
LNVIRRTFIATAVGSAAASGSGGMTVGPSGPPESGLADEAKTPRTDRPKLGTQQGAVSDAQLRFYQRFGVEAICAAPRAWTVEEIRALKDRVEANGIALDMLDLPLGSESIESQRFPNIMLGRSPERDREIEEIRRMIRAAGEAGAPAMKYNLTILGVLRTGSTPGRGGAMYSTWDLARARRDGLTPAGRVGEDAMWERITYFLERVIPVAEECKVRLACHPHDPGVPADGFRGVARVLGTVDGLKRFVSIRESPYHGLNFCQGTVAEMLEDPRREIYDVIRWFGERKKIFNVHFRNIRGRRDRFTEVYPDEGDVDMARAMKVYKEVGYSGMMMPDHVPSHPEDPDGLQAFAFAFGYIRGLIQAE